MSLRSAGAGATLLVLASMALAGCSTGTGESTLTGEAADPGPFILPSVDLADLPEVLRAEALQAEERARRNPSEASALGDLAFHYLEYDFPMAAATCLERAARIEPEALRWRYYLGLAYGKAGEHARTISALEAAVNIDAGYAPALVRLGEALLDADPVRAGELFSRARSASPGSARALLGLGRSAQARGLATEAEAFYREAIQRAPGFARAHYALAMLLSASRRGEEAQRHLRQHARGGAPPSDDDPLMIEMRRKVAPSYLVVQGEVKRLTVEGRLDEALELLNRSMANDITGVTARKQLGEILGLKGRFAEAVSLYREVLAEAPSDHEARTNLGQALEGTGALPAAEDEYRTVLRSHPRYAPALVFLGRLLARSGRAEAGLELMGQGVQERPAEGHYRYLLGIELAKAGRTEEGRWEVATATRLMPDHAGARFTLGQLHQAAGDSRAARAAWEEAVALSPGLAEGWIGLAGLALADGDIDQAVLRAEEGCRRSGYRVRRHLELLARVYQAAGRRQEATEILARARALAP